MCSANNELFCGRWKCVSSSKSVRLTKADCNFGAAVKLIKAAEYCFGKVHVANKNRPPDDCKRCEEQNRFDCFTSDGTNQQEPTAHIVLHGYVSSTPEFIIIIQRANIINQLIDGDLRNNWCN